MEMMKLKDVLRIASLWKEIGGASKLEIGALEPLLWKDKNYDISDMVFNLTQMGFQVNITTNAQLLSKFNQKLFDAGLNKLRISWHTTNPLLFKEISGGYGDYQKFFTGIEESLNLGLKISFNRVLLKGFVGDLNSQVKIIENYGARLKLYTLMWTPENHEYYQKFFLDWRPVIRQIPNIQKIERDRYILGRDRLKFHLLNNALLEVKVSETIDRQKSPCNTCIFSNQCEEAFGDYLRIDPNLLIYFCYMRKDLGFSFKDTNTSTELKNYLDKYLVHEDVNKIPLRLTVSPFCNFNCRIPGKEKGWCMESNEGYNYPKIQKTIL
jgi:cyclic pyranopterin phosphate synthase